MSLVELIRLAISRLGTSRVRAALTMLGVIIGVASVVALVAVGQGTSTGITDRITSLGTNLLTINAGATVSGGVRQAAGSATTLTLEDAAAVGAIEGVAGGLAGALDERDRRRGRPNTTTTILGTTPRRTRRSAPTSVWQGSFLTDTAVEQSLRVAVLGLHDRGRPRAGRRRRRLRDHRSAASRSRSWASSRRRARPAFQSGDDQVLIPVSTLKRYFTGSSSSGVRSIGVSVATAGQMPAVKAEITSLLEERHDIGVGRDGRLHGRRPDPAPVTATSVFGLLTVLLAGIASITSSSAASGS